MVGYGCTTCIGNSGPLPQEVSTVVDENDLVVASVLCGNRNFEGRINSEVRANYLMSPPLVVAFALAGRIDFDLYNEPLGIGKDGKPGLSAATSGRRQKKWTTTIRTAHQAGDMFRKTLRRRVQGRRALARTERARRARPSPGSDSSTYVKKPPYFDEHADASPRR